jgi:hypothetical protein
MKDMCDFPMAKIVYVMTDFTESNFKFWADHPALKPFVDSGQLDMAIFDAVNDTTIKLSRSGVELTPGSVVNPICIVANYLFDTLCHDVFQVRMCCHCQLQVRYCQYCVVLSVHPQRKALPYDARVLALYNYTKLQLAFIALQLSICDGSSC